MGKIHIEGSKSQAQRAILMASVFGAQLKNVPNNQDVLAAYSFAKAMGASIQGESIVAGTEQQGIVNAKESATVLRMGLPLMLAKYGNAHFVLEDSLAKRPMDSFFEFCKVSDIEVEIKDNAIVCKGFLKAGEYHLQNIISSQFLSGLLMGLSVLSQESKVYYHNIPSMEYAQITLDILKKFNVHIQQHELYFYIPSCNAKSADIEITADWSSAAPFLIAQCFGYPVDLEGNFSKNQPDAKLLEILQSTGFTVQGLHIKKEKPLHAQVINCQTIPDIVPLLALLFTQVPGQSVLLNVERLQYKESNRLQNTLHILQSLGANIHYQNNAFYIQGKKEQWQGGITVDTSNDHRMVMLAAIAQLNCKHNLNIRNKDAVQKSYPNFWEDYAMLRGHYEYLE